ncbi:hypothetical protein BDD12DRAFT_864511 [Trichophaea hybrida]|nr:hypothetical protein BDD12DRAFT_864511 [Trichophaea hybrida]
MVQFAGNFGQPFHSVEVVGLKDLPPALRRPGSQNEYLYTQIFARIMYIAATACMWLLRAWKVGDNDPKAMFRASPRSLRNSKR